MYTLKFISIYDGESAHRSTQTCIECPHFSVDEFDHGYIVTTYPDMTKKNGVDRHVTLDKDRVGRFSACFVMNSVGKTIDKVEVPAKS